MSRRKPFEALKSEGAFGGKPGIALEQANAAIAQDHAEYKALRDTLCITERDLDRAINDRDAIKDERDTLREENAKLQSEAGNLREAFDEIAHLRKENERLKMEYTEAETAFENLIQDYREGRDKAQVKLAEAIHIIEHYSECDAYKKAKAENDERFQLERDQARAERDALREENEKLREQCDRYDHIIPSMAKGRNDFRSALKKTRAQLAEAVKVLDGLVKHCAEAHYEDCSIMYDLDEEKCDCGSGAAHDKARDFLAKAKT